VLVISYVGFTPRQITLTQKSFTAPIAVALQLVNSPLDDVQIIAYGTTSKRLNTSSTVTVKGETLNNAPVANPLMALEGRAAGVVITQTSGVPGAALKVQIRGRTRVDDANGADEEPLYIVDGVPMSTGNSNLNLIGSAISSTGTSGLSPFATINMADIESINILKDADATAIYGSRGASGVILITTKKAKAGAMRFDVKAATGGSRAKLPDILNTQQYVAMRKEAFKNDKIAMTNTNAYDLLLWDSTRDNNLAKQLIGGTASFTTAEASISGGTLQTQYMLGGGYYRETDVYPGEMPNTRASGHLNLTNKSADQKFTVGFIANYTASHNQTSAQDLAFKLTLPPNYLLYDSAGNLAWNEKGIQTDNPLAYLKQKYDAKTTNLNANLQLGYRISQPLSARISIGYNTVRVDERKNIPRSSINPNYFLPGSTQPNTGTSYFGNNNFKSWIVEPQLEYNKVIGSWGKINVLAGATLQDQLNDGYNFQVNNYTSDDFLGTLIGISPASFTNASSVNSEYKYAAVFGRINYNYANKYILNLSGRRDGSSRFGPNYRYSNFAAAGGAWLFSSENFMKPLSFLSFGKLRASYGVTGNDKIGDYKYIDLYSSNIFSPTYRDSTALSPTSLFRPDLHWERNKKLEFGLDLGFLNDRLLLNLAWYRNRSNDPLVQYPLPTTTGFSTITANLNSVVVENTGYEITLNTVNIRKTNFDWNTSFNITIPENKLLKFPGLASSSYASKFIIGKPLSLVYIARYMGVDPQTGLASVDDINKNGTFQVTNLNGDLYPAFDQDPKVYGGIQNDLRYKNFRLNIFLQFNQQYTQNWRSIFSTTSPGGIINVPTQVLDRWQQPGDVTNVQKFTTITPSSTSLTGNSAAYYSDARYTNAFYMRLKTVMLSYTLPAGVIKKMRMTGANVFMQGQNLFTFSPFSATDPETAFITRLSPLTTITAGLQLNF
jgi:TonB-linked SusC/RagA family outer membrane protein